MINIMDPNSNNQQNNPINPANSATPNIVNSPIQQPLQESQNPVQGPQLMQTPAQSPVTKNGGKGTILLIIILLLIIGISFFIIFTKNQTSKAPEVMTTESNTQSTTLPAIPSPTSVEAPTSLDDLDVSSPDADIQGLESATQGL